MSERSASTYPDEQRERRSVDEVRVKVSVPLQIVEFYRREAVRLQMPGAVPDEAFKALTTALGAASREIDRLKYRIEALKHINQGREELQRKLHLARHEAHRLRSKFSFLGFKFDLFILTSVLVDALQRDGERRFAPLISTARACASCRVAEVNIVDDVD